MMVRRKLFTIFIVSALMVITSVSVSAVDYTDIVCPDSIQDQLPVVVVKGATGYVQNNASLSGYAVFYDYSAKKFVAVLGRVYNNKIGFVVSGNKLTAQGYYTYPPPSDRQQLTDATFSDVYVGAYDVIDGLITLHTDAYFNSQDKNSEVKDTSVTLPSNYCLVRTARYSDWPSVVNYKVDDSNYVNIQVSDSFEVKQNGVIVDATSIPPYDPSQHTGDGGTSSDPDGSGGTGTGTGLNSDDKGFFSGLFNSIKNFFIELFKPITALINFVIKLISFLVTFIFVKIPLLLNGLLNLIPTVTNFVIDLIPTNPNVVIVMSLAASGLMIRIFYGLFNRGG